MMAISILVIQDSLTTDINLSPLSLSSSLYPDMSAFQPDRQFSCSGHKEDS